MMFDDPKAFLGAFAATASYATGTATASIQTFVDDDQAAWPGANPELRAAFGLGRVRLGRAWVRPADLPAAPAFGHLLTQDGREWTVEDAWPEGELLALGLSLGARPVAVTVRRLAEVSDGALGFRPVAADIWSGRAAIRDIGGRERLLSAREVGVGYRRGWMPACPDLAPGCLVVSPTETLHVVSAFTDPDRGWTVFEAEARQERQ